MHAFCRWQRAPQSQAHWSKKRGQTGQTLFNLNVEQNLIQHYSTSALSRTLSNPIQSENLSVEQNLVQVERSAKHYQTLSNMRIAQNLISDVQSQ